MEEKFKKGGNRRKKRRGRGGRKVRHVRCQTRAFLYFSHHKLICIQTFGSRFISPFAQVLQRKEVETEPDLAQGHMQGGV